MTEPNSSFDDDPVAKELEKEQLKSMQKPYDSLDMEYLQTEPAYGKEAPPEFYETLKKIKGKAEPLWNEDGTPKLDEYGRQKYAVTMEHLWDEFGYFVRDLRFGNISKFSGDTLVCEHYLALAGDCLSLGCAASFTTAYRRVIGKLELSQSVNGFFRKNRNTVRTERKNEEFSGNKKNFFGGNREEI